jgi:FtsP/CotA-like multicopper oxidase with cupredoxin domain
MKHQTRSIHSRHHTLLASLATIGMLVPSIRLHAQAAAPALGVPPQVISSGGKVDQPLTAEFAPVAIPGTAGQKGGTGVISARIYSAPGVKASDGSTVRPGIPGPTFVFKPGELLRLRFQNLLNASDDPGLARFDNNPQNLGGGAGGGFDDIRSHVSHEISIPNNGNLTNLHVHGLHVDPKQDNVTLLILPRDTSPGELSVGLQRFVPTINQWWARNYQYKIPLDHIPGTYWYHSHKHGSTSTQVENGMAGTLVMRPLNDADDIVPNLWNDDPAKTHDRVMMLQEISNYGTPQGLGGSGLGGGDGSGKGARNRVPGSGGGKNVAAGSALALGQNEITLNGAVQPSLTLAPGQAERWRFIMAGANHTAAGSLWVGKYVMPGPLDPNLVNQISAINTQQDANKYIKAQRGTQTFAAAIPTPLAQKMSGIVQLVALDGIPMRSVVDVSPASPTIGGAGNRFDIIVQPDDNAAKDGPYYVFENYPVPSLNDLAAAYPTLFGPGVKPAGAAQARYAAVSQGQLASGAAVLLPPATDSSQKPLPLLPNSDFYRLGTSYNTFTPPWGSIGANGSGIGPATNLPLAPLISGQAKATTGGVEAALPDAATLADFTRGRFQPMPDDQSVGGALPATAAVVMTLNIGGTPVMPATLSTLPQPLAQRVSALSPAGTATMLQRASKSGGLVPGTPAYVKPFPRKVSGRQVVVLDRGTFTFDHPDSVTGKPKKFRQFWINGRQFDIDDSVGEADATTLIQKPIVNVEPALGFYNPNGASPAWTHWTSGTTGPGITPQMLVVNPGYYRQIIPYTLNNGTVVYNYDYGFDPANPTTPKSTPQPNSKSLTGLDDNPSPPKSGTAEEWLLINNSDLYHPFHIHINPFFVEEIGQIHNVPPAGSPPTNSGAWSFKTIKWDPVKKAVINPSKSPFGWVVGNWWDVIMLPPHGYVRMKMWINVPDQAPLDRTNPDSDLVVQDDANTYGSWVFHCHILRHEDRGMMSMVNTEPRPVSLTGSWSGFGGTPVTIADSGGTLTVSNPSLPGTTIAGGNFNEGIGNTFVAQPFYGTVAFTATSPGVVAAPASICYSESSGVLAFSTGQGWVRSRVGSISSYVPPPVPTAPPGLVTLQGTWVDDTPERNVITINQSGGTAGSSASTPAVNGKPARLKFTPQSSKAFWWITGEGAWNAGAVSATNPNLNFAGHVTLLQGSRNQRLNFVVTQSPKGELKLILGNGVTLTRTGN